MKNGLIIIAFLLSFSLTGQSDSKKLPSFSSIDIATGVNITMYQGEPKADYTVKKGDVEDLIIEVRGNTLHIKFKSKNFGWTSNRSADIDLYGGSLNTVEASSGACFKSNFTFTVDDFELDASSGSSVTTMVECRDMEVDISSGAAVRVSGSTESLGVSASSGASYKGVDLQANSVDADASSGASIKVWATNSIKGEASSGGSIKYKGEPSKKDLDPNKMSGGSIRGM